MSEHCVQYCTLMMVCGIVLGKAKTTKVGMVWYEFNIVNESINESVTKVGIELLGQLKTKQMQQMQLKQTNTTKQIKKCKKL